MFLLEIVSIEICQFVKWKLFLIVLGIEGWSNSCARAIRVRVCDNITYNYC